MLLLEFLLYSLVSLYLLLPVFNPAWSAQGVGQTPSSLPMPGAECFCCQRLFRWVPSLSQPWCIVV